MRTTIISLLSFLLITTGSFAKSATSTKEKIELSRFEPSCWWIGMHDPTLQIMVYGDNIAETTPEFDYPGVQFLYAKKTDNPNYLFVYLNITPEAKAGNVKFTFKKGEKTIARQTLCLKNRKEDSAARTSFGPQDAVYLIMPDRFANGNTKNDAVKGYTQGVNRNELGERHGGDLQGVINQIPYIADLGTTALWLTPCFANNDNPYSYHHYSAGDYYKIDPRLGSNDDYKTVAETCHQNGLKLIIDVVPNHCGSSHWWVNDKPAKDWFYEWPNFTSSNYRLTASTDPYASKADKKRLTKGWFSGNMPDLNLENPDLFTYLKQAYVWWIEYAGVDGIRVDTYPYCNITTAARWIKSIRDEYPKMNVVGECWVKTPAEIAFYQSGSLTKYGFDSQLPSVMDFVLKDVFEFSFLENESWDKGMIRFYNHYAQDFSYADPSNIMNFLDNHDIDRYSEVVGQDSVKYKMALALLVASRGYPQIYAGDEIMLAGIRGNYEGHRFDFPGGWKEDSRSAFTPEGRTAKENDTFNYLRTLLHYRKNTTALQTGKMTQFIPYDGIYVYARYDKENTILVVTNNDEKDRMVHLERYAEVIGDAKEMKEVVSGTLFATDSINMPAKTAWLLELQK